MKGIYHYLELTENLLTSGMPTAEQMKEAAEAGVQVVVNLALATSQGALPEEEKLVQSLGMKYIHIPVEWNNPTRQNLDDFFTTLESHPDEKMLVHCQANYRVTCFVTLYRILRQGWDKDEAFAVMNKMWNPEDFPVWQQFIDENLARGS
ncbi:MAG TPA: protein tyrosine phosphatase family protein [Anaerolineales bacterium]|nr:protein tyrosine phosphatase family protein [Anaerolineales bacterium]